MAIETHALEMKLMQDGIELDVGLLCLQGLWTEEQYLKLTDQTNHLIEFSAGVLEMLPMPTDKHQAIVEFLHDALRAWLRRSGGAHRSRRCACGSARASFGSPMCSSCATPGIPAARIASGAAQTWWSKWSAPTTPRVTSS